MTSIARGAALGLDIGGANLKAAWYRPGHAVPHAVSRPFALWRDPAGLSVALADLLRDAAFPPAGRVGVTMTGELCDCFPSKRDGVTAILDAVAKAVPSPVLVWTIKERFVSLAEARHSPLTVAAANWLALATFAGRLVPHGPALLCDIGSTTTDIIPMLEGRPVPRGRTDPQRLRTGELVYTGTRRTPVCALVSEGVAAELFATMRDVYLVLGQVEELSQDQDTADGGPATRAAAELRLARMLGADLETSTPAERHHLAQRALERQRALVRSALAQVADRLAGPMETIVLAGEGERLARHVVQGCPFLSSARLVSLHEELGETASRSACAHAVAVLAAEET